MKTILVLCAGLFLGATGTSLSGAAHDASPARHRVIVSTDIGGTDYDDFQSLVHLLVYADSLDVEGLISSPYGDGRKEHILQIVDLYERDYPNLKTWSDRYPSPEALRAITKQGETEVAPYAGVRRATAGSEWIVQCARRDDPRPLHVLVWGGIEDLAQALHDAPDILPKLRVYFIGGPNLKWSVDAYHYVATQHRDLWIIEANETYWGWFTGGNQDADRGNDTFVASHVAGRGALGEFFARDIRFANVTRTSLKMGDSPSVGWLLHGRPHDPTFPGWGGQFVRAWERVHRVFDRLTTEADTIEQFGVFELVLPLGVDAPALPAARMVIENQQLVGFADGQGAIRFRFSPKEAKVYPYTIQGNLPALDGQAGALTAVKPAPDAASRPAADRPNWWTDDPSPARAVGQRLGALTVSRWREDFLMDFAARLRRCASPAPARRPREAETGSAALVIGAAGDSTVVTRPPTAHGRGWVQMLQPEFKPGVVVHNLARGGRSSKSFYEEGLWEQLLALRPDYVFVQFGHNDSKSEEYRRTDPQTTYKEYLRRYVDEAVAAGVQIVLITPMERRHFGPDGKIDPTNDGYAQATRQVAEEKDVLVIDVHSHSVALLEGRGFEATHELGSVPTDRTHWSAAGAQLWADFIGAELRRVTDPRYARLVAALRSMDARDSGHPEQWP
jgi:lysophospholipase L1-like esterase